MVQLLHHVRPCTAGVGAKRLPPPVALRGNRRALTSSLTRSFNGLASAFVREREVRW